MATKRKRISAVYMGDEGGSYGVDPDSDGSDYLWVPAENTELLQDGLELLDTAYDTGENRPTEKLAGRDGWSFGYETPFMGLPAAAGVGVAAAATDWLNRHFEHLIGPQAAYNGTTVTGSAAGTITPGVDVANDQDLICVYEADKPSANGVRSQWRRIWSGGGTATYTITPNWDSNPTVAAVLYGVMQYVYREAGGGANSRAFYVRQDDDWYRCLGGRCTGAVLTGELNRKLMIKWTWSGDTKVKVNKPASLPAPDKSAVRGVRCLLSPFWFNGTRYSTRRFEFDFAPQASEVESTEATNGRQDYESTAMLPRLTVEPLFDDGILNLKRNATLGPMLLQLGAAAFDGTRLNGGAIFAEQGQVLEANPTDANGRIRQGVQIEIQNAGLFNATSNVSRFFTLARV